MSYRWLLWILLASLTGRPVASLLVVLLLWWVTDRFTFQFLPDPLRWLARRQRERQLRRLLDANPSDRRARLELAQLLLERRRPAEAAALVRRNVEAGDEDLHTAFALGAALARSGNRERAEPVLAVARQLDPAFRLGEIDLELGRLRVRAGDFAGAREALTRLVAARPGTVEGRWLLGEALRGLGQPAAAAEVREAGWREYQGLPRFRRRHERPFAWRIKPWRPALVALLLLLGGAVTARLLAPAVAELAGEREGPSPLQE